MSNLISRRSTLRKHAGSAADVTAAAIFAHRPTADEPADETRRKDYDHVSGYQECQPNLLICGE